MTLHYRASVIQNTGEDWDDVNLTLSTAELSTSMSVPMLLRSIVRDYSGNFIFGKTNTGQPLFQTNNAATQSNHHQLQLQQQQQQQQYQQQQSSQPSLFGQPQITTFGQPTQQHTFGQTSAPGASIPSGSGVISGGFGAFGAPASAAGLFGGGSFAPVQTGPPAFSFGTTSTATETTGSGLFGFQTIEPHRHQLDDGEPQSPVLVASNPELQPLDHAGAEAKDQVLASTYLIDTAVRIQSDRTPHRVTIMTVQLAATTEYVVIPKVTRSVFLQVGITVGDASRKMLTLIRVQCKVKNTSPHQFPPGPMVTYLDGSYVERSNILVCVSTIFCPTAY